MQKGKVLNLKYFNNIIGFTLKNKILILLTLFFVFGLFFGVLSFGRYELVTEYIQIYLEDFITDRTKSQYFKIFFDSLFSSLIYIFISFCFGTSMFGTVLIMPLIAFRAYCYGSFMAFLYTQYSIKGIAFNAVMVLPSSIFFIVALLLSSCESIKFSLLLANQTFIASEYKNLSLCFKNYCLKHIVIIVLVIVSALVDTLISTNFLRTFNLF